MPLVFVLSVVAALPETGQFPPASCAWVRAENDGAGAGFVVDVERRLLVTCRHVVAGRSKVDVIFPWIREGNLVTDRADYLANRATLRARGLLITGRVLKKADEFDLALIQLESLPQGIRAATLAVHPALPGDTVWSVGHRTDLDTVWNVTSGWIRVSGRLVDGYFWRGEKLAVNVDALIAQFAIEEGDSGAAVFNAHGEVAGLVAALRRQSPLSAILISARAIRSFMGSPEPPAPKPQRTAVLAEVLHRATVWVQPNATNIHRAGVLIDRDIVLTSGNGLSAGERVGIALPFRKGEEWVTERAMYRDPLELHLKGNWRGGTILARDADRNLALIRLDSSVRQLQPLRLASGVPRPGEAIHTLNHPGGVEFGWVYARGIVRQCGRLHLASGDNTKQVSALLCQFPAQTGSPGGAVANDRGELIGIVVPKESVQLVAYAVRVDEIADFLDCRLFDHPARTVRGLWARVEVLPELWLKGMALGLARHAEKARLAGQTNVADRDLRAAIALDPGCAPARICRAQLLLPADEAKAMQELDAAVEAGPMDRVVLQTRAELAVHSKDWRKARGDLEGILDSNPEDAPARESLADVYLELGENAKAAKAIADTLRADPMRRAPVAAKLLVQADRLATRYPNVPSIPADWLTLAMTSSKCDAFADALKHASGAGSPAERLALLRAGVKKVVHRK